MTTYLFLEKEKSKMPPALYKVIEEFFCSYLAEIPPNFQEKATIYLKKWFSLCLEEMRKPHPFEIYHQAIRTPFDYYQFGLELIRPLVDFAHSQILGAEKIVKIENALQQGENIILLANHQTEPDPQIMSLLLEREHPKLAEEMIFVAGHRVVTDPVAIPMSLGRNLLCIFSKKYMDFPPEEKSAKVVHNRRTMKKMQDLLHEGGKCIYVAPSGGRDRRNGQGLVELAPFDPNSLELFALIAKGSKVPTHFYPLALKTFDLMPPPDDLAYELGERRQVNRTPLFMGFGSRLEIEDILCQDPKEKRKQRIVRANNIQKAVQEIYDQFPE